MGNGRDGKAPAFQFYAADWLADARVRLMSLEARGAHIELMAYSWREGALPTDPDKLARLLAIPRADFDRIWPEIAPAWQVDDGGEMTQRRLERQRAEMAAHRKAKSAAGKKGAQARWSQEVNSTAIDVPMAKNSPSSASATATSNTSPTDSTERRVEKGHMTGPELIEAGAGVIAARYLPRIRQKLRPGEKPNRHEEGRDCSVVTQMLHKGYDPVEIEDAIDGLAWLRDHGAIDWLPKGQPATMRALYNTKSGVMPVWTQAVHAAHKHIHERKPKRKSGLKPFTVNVEGAA